MNTSEKENQIWKIQKSNIQYQTLYEQISNSLEDMIIQNGIDFMRLPTENELCQQYGVSRSVIREALKLLKERGLVSMRAGDGSYTVKPNSQVMEKTLKRVIRYNRLSDNNITEVRIALEVVAAKDAALSATDAEIDELKAIVTEMENSKNNIQQRVEWDYQFHKKIASISKNILLEYFIESLMGIMKDYIKVRLKKNPEGNKLGIIWHNRIIEAISSHDPVQAEACMREHLDISFHQLDALGVPFKKDPFSQDTR